MAFDFTDAMWSLMDDIARACPELGHVDMGRVAVGFGQARSNRLDGIYAQLYPLRFPGGGRRLRRGEALFELPRLVFRGLEALYLVKFMLPRYLLVPFAEKLPTVFHEMYHMSTDFDGTLRTFAGRNCYHTSSRQRFDRHAAKLANDYLAATARPELHQFLKRSFRELSGEHGGVVGTRYRNLRPMRVR